MIAYVDANVLIRFLVRDSSDMVQKVSALMEAVQSGDITLRIDQITVAEIVWVLTSYYKLKAADVATQLFAFLSQDGLEVDSLVLSALATYGAQNVDFADALLAARMQQSGLKRVFSFDKHFDRIEGIERLVPGVRT